MTGSAFRRAPVVFTALQMPKSVQLLRRIAALAAFTGVVVIACAACNGDRPPEVRSGYPVASTCPDHDAEDYYLARDRLSYGEAPDAQIVERLSRLLDEAAQPTLWCGEGPAEIYRVVWLPSYRPAHIATLVARGPRWETTTVTFVDPRDSDAARAAPWRLETHAQEFVESDQAAEAIRLVEAAGFWRLPTLRLADGDGNDGGQLVLEARKDTAYQIVVRWQPDAEPLGEAARAIIRLAGGTIPDGLVNPNDH